MPTFRTNDGVSLGFLDEGSGPPVVLIAGYTAPATSWVLTADALVAAGHRVVSLDRRSHGDSESPLFGQRMSRHGKDIAELLDHLGLDDAALVGGSMGGNTIWAYVDLFGTSRVSGIVVVDQTPKMINTADWPHGFYGLTPENAGTMFADGVPQTGRGRTVDRSAEGLAPLVARLGGVPAFRDGTAAETIRLLQDHVTADWRDVLARTEVPFLLVAGAESQVWPPSHAAAAVGDNPHGRVVVVPDAGHAVNFDQNAAFNAALLEFLATL